MQWKHVFGWYAAMLIVGGFSSFAAYELPGSAAWRIWSGHFPWAVDMLRLTICTIFALFTIWHLRLLEPECRTLADEVLDGWKVWIPLLVPLVAVAATVTFASQAFIEGLIARKYPIPADPFDDIYRPYIPYSFYVAALWGGVGAPVLAMLATRIRHDIRELRVTREKLEGEFRVVEAAPAATALFAFQESELAMQDYVARLKSVAERYVPVLLTVATVLLYEQFTPSHASVTRIAHDLGQLGLWLLLGPALLTLMTIVTFNYQAAVRRAGEAYRTLLDRLDATQTDVRACLLESRAKLMWESSSGNFALSILKSTPVFVLLVSSVTFYVLSNLDAKSRITLFVPQMILDLLGNVFQ